MPAATVLNSEVHIMESASNGRTYRITVALPLGYYAAPDSKWPFNNKPAKWPTVYVVDGDQYAGMVTDMIRPASWCGNISDAIVVGIGYPEGADAIATFHTYFTRRDHDMTPVRDEQIERGKEEQFGIPNPTGDAAGFLRFIADDLIPFIESAYDSDAGKRTFVGCSFGGLFGLYSMLNRPGLFATVIAGSPYLEYVDRVLFKLEAAYAAEHNELPGTLLVFATDGDESSNEYTLSETIRMTAILQGRKYVGLTLIMRLFQGLTHCEVAAPGIHAGLIHALKKPR